MQLRVFGIGVLTAGLVGCTHTSSHQSLPVARQTGTIEGQLLAVGGPAGASAERLPGNVTVTGKHVRRVVVLSSDGRFRIELPAGPYRLVGNSPHFIIDGAPGNCDPQGGGPARVHAGVTTNVDVLCQRK